MGALWRRIAMRLLCRYCLIALSAAALGWCAPASAVDWNAASLNYGRGVHAYFDGQDAAAEQSLSRSIESNPNDPRPYYFRAMSRMRQGRDYEARQDMLVGATIEARAPQRYAVGTALERVQGQDRLVLECYRRQARLDAATQRDVRSRTRYENSVDREPEVLRREVDVPLDLLVEPAPTQELMRDKTRSEPLQTPPAESLGDPFVDDPKPATSQEAVVVPPQQTPPAFPPQGDAPTAEPTESSPAQPVPPKPTETPSSDLDEEDPFGF